MPKRYCDACGAFYNGREFKDAMRVYMGSTDCETEKELKMENKLLLKDRNGNIIDDMVIAITISQIGDSENLCLCGECWNKVEKWLKAFPFVS